MERNDETLSTRDLAPTVPSGRRTGDGEGRDEASVRPERSEVDTTEGDGGVGTESRAPQEDSAQPQAPASVETVPAGSETAGTRAPGSGGETSSDDEALLAAELSADFQRRWEVVQTRFVDEPRGAVEDADSLVANVMQQLADDFAQERERLEAQWARGEDISTEDLRIALQRYRSFFRRLLST